MDKNLFYQQADLLISILPYMTKDTEFALHGGTAINFFVRDMPVVKWKLVNLMKMSDGSHKEAVVKLRSILEKSK